MTDATTATRRRQKPARTAGRADREPIVAAADDDVASVEAAAVDAASATRPLHDERPAQAAEPATAAATSGPRAALLASLRRLDALLAEAVEQQVQRQGPGHLLDPWLGMHLDDAGVRRLLDEQGTVAHGEGGNAARLLAAAMLDVDVLAQFANALGLDRLDLAIVLIALAPDVDLRYERIYGYLHDDLTRRRPTPDLIANLLATDAEGRLAVLDRLSRASPLVVHGVLKELGPAGRSVLAHEYAVDPIWRAWLLGAGIDDALPSGCVLGAGDGVGARGPALDPATRDLLEQARRSAASVPLRLALHGAHGSGKLNAAAALADRLGLRLLKIDLRDAATSDDIATPIERGARVACMFGALLYVHGIGRLEQRDPQLLRALVNASARAPCHVVIASVEPLPATHATALPLLRIELRYPGPSTRALIWRSELGRSKVAVDDSVVAALAARFSLSAAQIAQASAEARLLALQQHATHLGYAELAAAARRQCGGDLARIATRIVPRAGFADLVAPLEVRTQLRELCERVATRDRVGADWAADSVHARVPGVTALFVGPSGTGKTLSAEAVAGELGLDLYRIDLAGIVSKYIGETEKNLDRVFAAAAHSNAVLFFDEADALFGKRSEVKDAHDRYANIEVAYLLQKMEQFDGLAILATNLKQNLDEAFARRLTFTINFPFPEAAERLRLWQQLWPTRVPRHGDVDLGWFAREFRLSGGNIRNAVLAAAHLAATDDSAISHAHLLHATRREFQKLGKNLAGPAAVSARGLDTVEVRA